MVNSQGRKPLARGRWRFLIRSNRAAAAISVAPPGLKTLSLAPLRLPGADAPWLLTPAPTFQT
jgi:hypothetical protein